MSEEIELQTGRGAVDEVREVLGEALGGECGASEVEEPEFVAAGADCTVYEAAVRVDGGVREVVVRLPRSGIRDGRSERVRRAVRAQKRLAGGELPFAVPRPLGTVATADGLAVVETRAKGVELAEAASRGLVDPVEVTAGVAAACHGVDDPAIRRHLGGPVDRCDHGVDAMEVFDGLADPVFRRAGSRCRKMLPEARSTRLLHGDLLGQNILVTDEGSVSVVDWNDVRLGDPAFDLAAVMRGYETVFGTGESRSELLAAYDRRVDDEVSADEVRFWELVILARQWQSADGEKRREWLRERVGEILERGSGE